MEKYLDTQNLPVYCFSHFRCFEQGERHVNRRCGEDVLLLMLGGVLRFSENHIPVELSPGEYYIQQKDLFQQGILESDVPYYYYVHFHGVWNETDGIKIRGIFSRDVPALAQKLSGLNARNAPLLAKTAVFYEILSQLRWGNKKTEKEKLAESMAKLLQSRVRGGISTDELSRKLNFSKNYLIRVFKDVYGETPHRYLTSLRIRQSEELLRYSDLSLEQIADECGFGCYINFYKAYGLKNGISPGAARKKE